MSSGEKTELAVLTWEAAGDQVSWATETGVGGSGVKWACVCRRASVPARKQGAWS